MKAIRRNTFLLIACTTFAVAARNNQVMAWFEKANAAYKKQQYDTAIACYHKIADEGMRNSALFYNMGNAYFRKDNVGMALLYYEKARLLSPNDQDITANIKFVNRHITDRVPEPGRGFLEYSFHRLHTLLSLHTQLWTAWVLILILSILFSAGLFVPRNLRLWFVYLGSLCVVCLMLVALSAGIKIYKAENTSEAIVLEESLHAVNEPEGSKVLFTVHEGVKFRIHQRNEGWYLVSLPNGAKGWVEQSALGEI